MKDNNNIFKNTATENFNNNNKNFDKNFDNSQILNEILINELFRTNKLEVKKKLYNKLYFLFHKYCFYYFINNKNKEYKNHSSTACDLFQHYENNILKFKF